MSNDKMGGPAFPQTITEGVQGDRTFPHEYGLGGMTLWDYYAAHTPAKKIEMALADGMTVAEACAMHADSMLAERAKRQGGAS